MGAFFLYHKNSQINEQAVQKLYDLKGFNTPFQIPVGDYFLYIFRKQVINFPNYLQYEANYIFVTGSLFYKGLSYKESLESLILDFSNNSIDSKNLYGNYVILFYNGIGEQITFCIDPAFIKNVYFDQDKKVITSDFLALTEAFPRRYTLNKLAVIENLTTGSLISPDTYANEIQKLDRVNISSIEAGFPGIKFHSFCTESDSPASSHKEAIQNANDNLSKYFNSVRNLTDEYGAHIGLTGGFDSRLLLMHAKKHLKNLITNSFWRRDSIEYINAKNLANAAGLDFFSFEESPFIKPEKEEMLTRSFYFFDGQIRSQNNWDEEFSLSDYALQLASNHYVGFHGCGGEQYRNSERLVRRINIETYIKYDWMFKQAGNLFTDNALKNLLIRQIKNKIKRFVNINNDKTGLLEIKKIQNEIWNTANRATRINLLNQQQFYLAPFSEFQISYNAYNYVPFLGSSFAFQIEMMKSIDKELSSLKTNYGFNLFEGESLQYKLMSLIINLLPRFLYYTIYQRIKNKNNDLLSKNSVKIYHQFFEEYQNKIDFRKISRNKNLGNSLYSFDFMLKQLDLKMQ